MGDRGWKSHPVQNILCEERYVAYCQEKHRERLANIKSRIDYSEPETNKMNFDVATSPKRLQLVANRQAEIDLENKKLLDKIMKIETSDSRTTFRPSLTRTVFRGKPGHHYDPYSGIRCMDYMNPTILTSPESIHNKNHSRLTGNPTLQAKEKYAQLLGENSKLIRAMDSYYSDYSTKKLEPSYVRNEQYLIRSSKFKGPQWAYFRPTGLPGNVSSPLTPMSSGEPLTPSRSYDIGRIRSGLFPSIDAPVHSRPSRVYAYHAPDSPTLRQKPATAHARSPQRQRPQTSFPSQDETKAPMQRRPTNVEPKVQLRPAQPPTKPLPRPPVNIVPSSEARPGSRVGSRVGSENAARAPGTESTHAASAATAPPRDVTVLETHQELQETQSMPKVTQDEQVKVEPNEEAQHELKEVQQQEDNDHKQEVQVVQEQDLKENQEEQEEEEQKKQEGQEEQEEQKEEEQKKQEEEDKPEEQPHQSEEVHQEEKEEEEAEPQNDEDIKQEIDNATTTSLLEDEAIKDEASQQDLVDEQKEEVLLQEGLEEAQGEAQEEAQGEVQEEANQDQVYEDNKAEEMEKQDVNEESGEPPVAVGTLDSTEADHAEQSQETATAEAEEILPDDDPEAEEVKEDVLDGNNLSGYDVVAANDEGSHHGSNIGHHLDQEAAHDEDHSDGGEGDAVEDQLSGGGGADEDGEVVE